MQNCPKKKCLISALAVFVFMSLYEHFFHGCPWMVNMYQQTAALWRTPEAMKEMMPWFIGKDVILALIFTCLYKKFAMAYMSDAGTCSATGEKKACCPIQRGLCFGMKIGLLLGTLQGSAYAYMPIPLDLAIAWFVGGVVEGLGIGLVLSLICNKKECDKA